MCPDPIIIQGPNGSPLKAALIGCGGTGCNILAEGELSPAFVRIAMGSEPDTMNSLKVDRRILADARKFEAAAKIPGKALRIAGSDFEADISKAIEGTDISFIMTGLGGLSGGWGAVIAARAAGLSRGIGFCVASVPFSVEGGSRRERATAQLKALSGSAEGTLAIPNDMILSEAPGLPINRAFRVMNSVLVSPVNLFLRSIGSDDIGIVRKHLGGGKLLTMDSAEWDRENAEFAVIECLAKSKWLGIDSGNARGAILFVEGHCLYDGMNELGRLFSRALGNDSQVIVASAGDRKSGLRVTAVVGF
jgi:cell division protein FtsZ